MTDKSFTCSFACSSFCFDNSKSLSILERESSINAFWFSISFPSLAIARYSFSFCSFTDTACSYLIWAVFFFNSSSLTVSSLALASLTKFSTCFCAVWISSFTEAIALSIVCFSFSNASCSLRRPSRFELFLKVPPEREPPGWNNSPSNVTIRTRYWYFLLICIAWSIVSTRRKRPNRYSIINLYFSSQSTLEATFPRTPSSSRISSRNGFSFFGVTVVSGKNVARPKRFFFKYWIIRFATCSSSVTIFWIFPPSAVSTAVIYFSFTRIISATTPSTPGSCFFCSITRRILWLYPS